MIREGEGKSQAIKTSVAVEKQYYDKQTSEINELFS